MGVSSSGDVIRSGSPVYVLRLERKMGGAHHGTLSILCIGMKHHDSSTGAEDSSSTPVYRYQNRLSRVFGQKRKSRHEFQGLVHSICQRGAFAGEECIVLE